MRVNKLKATGVLIAVIAVLSLTTDADGQTRRRKKVKPKLGYYTTQIFNGSVAVNPSGMVWFPIDADNMGGRVIGRFQAQGGTSNDIECFIVDEDGLLNLRNGNQAWTFYRSGRVTVADINVFLVGRRYYLVFSNRTGWVARNVFGSVGMTITYPLKP